MNLAGGGGGGGGVGDEERTPSNLTALEGTLAHYRGRVRSTVDEWMGHYRQTIGISVPAHLRATLSRSGSPSPGQSGAAGSTRQLHSSRSYAGEVVHSRPASQATHYHTHPLPSRVTSPLGGQRSPRPLQEAEEGGANCVATPTLATPLPVTPTSPSTVMRTYDQPLSDERPSEGQRVRKTRRRSSSVPSNKNCGCPVALHNLLLKNLTSCKCDKRRPPYICDLEYDTFLRDHAPSKQVVVVCILSSVVEGSCPCEPMLDALHCSLNRRRFSPCTQSSGDAFRLLKYDLCHCLSGTTRATPLLVERHRVWPGMFLMYVGGHLVHADCVFNGYGTTKRDFLKQVERCSQSASKGHFLPVDYRFTVHTGARHPASTSWAYPLGGVLGFLVPYSPSVSHCSSQHEAGQRLAGEGEFDDGDNMSQQFGRSGVLQSELDLSQSQTLSQQLS